MAYDPESPVTVSPVKVARPVLSVVVVAPVRMALPETSAAVTSTPAVFTGLPPESINCTVGGGLIACPRGAGEGACTTASP